jgi:4-hydroxymandelate oxidase
MEMNTTPGRPVTRRSFLYGLSALPAILTPPMAGAMADDLPPSEAFRREAPPIKSAGDVLNVMEFEPLARAALPPAHFGYLATGVDDDKTVLRNHEAFGHYEIRAHRFSDLSRMDTTRTVFGARWTSPLYLSAVSGMHAFHPEGELGVARAARSRAMQMMLSTGASVAVEPVAQALGAPFWQQVYPTDDWAVTAAIVKRAEQAGCSAIALTVDSHGSRNNETLIRAMRVDNRTCVACHVGNSHDMWRRGPMFTGLDVSRVTTLAPANLTPAYLDRIRALVKVKLIIKGIVTGEDVGVAIEHGADGVVISNHGGRQEDSLRASIDCLPEAVVAARGRIPVFVDGGIRRGTDVFKALALGATAVGIGRPQGWGLAAFGQPGVEAVIDIYNRELLAIMRQAGTPTIDAITNQSVVRSIA